MESYLKELNEKQREAVLTTTGPVLIVAGAGAGKTKTITHRMFHLIKTGVAPANILAITFTNKAAREMKERIGLQIEGEHVKGGDLSLRGAGSPASTPFVSTFHALGVYIMKQNAALLGLSRFFGIYDKGDGKRLVKEILIEKNYDPKQIDPGKILNAISREKGNFVTVNEYIERIEKDGSAANFTPKIIAAVWPEYEKRLRAERAVDLDDLLLITAKLLEKNLEVRKYYQNLWKYIHIDEYQDTNTVQYQIVRLLGEMHRNICVVGDTDQNIYSWRGADISNMLRFEKDYPEAKVVLLEENYRSTKTIIAAANTVIQKNKLRIEKNLFTENPDGEKIGLFEAWGEAEEAFFVTSKVRELIRGNAKDGLKPTPFGEIAVLYRANFQSRILEEAFVGEGIPYAMIGTKFYERKEIKDMLSYLQAALNPESIADVSRVINVPPRGIGMKTLEKIKAGNVAGTPPALSGTVLAKVKNFYSLLEKISEIAHSKPPSETLKFILKESGLEEMLSRGTEEDKERLENIKELVTLAKRYDSLPFGEGVELFLSDAALATNEEAPKEVTETSGGKKDGKKVDAVKLMTVHAAKGLEFDYVFVTGMEQDLFPHHRANEGNMTPHEAEEERRLFYVALTRARKKVFLSYATMRTVFGERNVNLPSEFLSDIPPDHMELEYVIKPSDDGDRPRKVIEF